jgi:hypothetical protein
MHNMKPMEYRAMKSDVSDHIFGLISRNGAMTQRLDAFICGFG